MTFKSKIVLPVSKIEAYLSQLEFRDYMQLQKYLLEDNNEYIQQFFYYLIQTYCGINLSDVNAVDKAALLLHLRSISCGDVISFVNHSNVKLHIQLSDVLHKLKNVRWEEVSEQCLSKDVLIHHSIPYDLFSANILRSVICKIAIGNETFDLKQYSEQEKANIFESLHYDVGLTIKFLLKQQKSSTIILLEGNSNIKLDEISINPFNQSLFEFIKFVFKDDLMNMYKNIHILSSRSHINTNYLMQIPPVEHHIYLKLLVDEAEEREKQFDQLKDKSPYVNTRSNDKK